MRFKPGNICQATVFIMSSSACCACSWVLIHINAKDSPEEELENSLVGNPFGCCSLASSLQLFTAKPLGHFSPTWVIFLVLFLVSLLDFLK